MGLDLIATHKFVSKHELTPLDSYSKQKLPHR